MDSDILIWDKGASIEVRDYDRASNSTTMLGAAMRIVTYAEWQALEGALVVKNASGNDSYLGKPLVRLGALERP